MKSSKRELSKEVFCPRPPGKAHYIKGSIFSMCHMAILLDLTTKVIHSFIVFSEQE